MLSTRPAALAAQAARAAARGQRPARADQQRQRVQRVDDEDAADAERMVGERQRRAACRRPSSRRAAGASPAPARSPATSAATAPTRRAGAPRLRPTAARTGVSQNSAWVSARCSTMLRIGSPWSISTSRSGSVPATAPHSAAFQTAVRRPMTATPTAASEGDLRQRVHGLIVPARRGRSGAGQRDDARRNAGGTDEA